MSDENHEQLPSESASYGQGDASYVAAGQEAGLTKLVEEFYGLMAREPRCERLFRMHPTTMDVSVDKLARFFCGWLGGPKRYNEKYGVIRLPMAHAHLPVTEQDKENWLWCMEQVLENQPYEPAFKIYLMEQLRRPAERIVMVCQQSGAAQS